MEEDIVKDIWEAHKSKLSGVGTYEDFRTAMSTPEDRKIVYDNLLSDVGDYNDFESLFAASQKPKTKKIKVTTGDGVINWAAGTIEPTTTEQEVIVEVPKVKTIKNEIKDLSKPNQVGVQVVTKRPKVSPTVNGYSWDSGVTTADVIYTGEYDRLLKSGADKELLDQQVGAAKDNALKKIKKEDELKDVTAASLKNQDLESYIIDDTYEDFMGTLEGNGGDKRAYLEMLMDGADEVKEDIKYVVSHNMSRLQEKHPNFTQYLEDSKNLNTEEKKQAFVNKYKAIIDDPLLAEVYTFQDKLAEIEPFKNGVKDELFLDPEVKELYEQKELAKQNRDGRIQKPTGVEWADKALDTFDRNFGRFVARTGQAVGSLVSMVDGDTNVGVRIIRQGEDLKDLKLKDTKYDGIAEEYNVKVGDNTVVFEDGQTEYPSYVRTKDGRIKELTQEEYLSYKEQAKGKERTKESNWNVYGSMIADAGSDMLGQILTTKGMGSFLTAAGMGAKAAYATGAAFSGFAQVKGASMTELMKIKELTQDQRENISTLMGLGTAVITSINPAEAQLASGRVSSYIANNSAKIAAGNFSVMTMARDIVGSGLMAGGKEVIEEGAEQLYEREIVNPIVNNLYGTQLKTETSLDEWKSIGVVSIALGSIADVSGNVTFSKDKYQMDALMEVIEKPDLYNAYIEGMSTTNPKQAAAINNAIKPIMDEISALGADIDINTKTEIASKMLVATKLEQEIEKIKNPVLKKQKENTLNELYKEITEIELGKKTTKALVEEIEGTPKEGEEVKPPVVDEVDTELATDADSGTEVATMETDTTTTTDEIVDVAPEDVTTPTKPEPNKVNVLGQEVNFYNNYIPETKEDIEDNAVYSFSAPTKEGLPEKIRDKAKKGMEGDVNGKKVERWSASIGGAELKALIPETTPTEKVAPEAPKQATEPNKLDNFTINLANGKTSTTKYVKGEDGKWRGMNSKGNMVTVTAPNVLSQLDAESNRRIQENSQPMNREQVVVEQVGIEAKKADIERREGFNGLEEIIFSNPNFRLEGFEIDGNYWNVITSTDRAKVLVNINGVIVPFYLTTGQAGKGLVPGWYPFFGIGKDGWLNKTDKSDMEAYYERYWGKDTADIVKSISEELSSFYGTEPSAFKNDGDPNATSRPLSTLADKVEDYINSKLNYTPAINNADARKTLRSNVEQLGKEINAKYDAELDALEKQQSSPVSEQVGNDSSGEDWSKDVESTAKALDDNRNNDLYSDVEDLFLRESGEPKRWFTKIGDAMFLKLKGLKDGLTRDDLKKLNIDPQELNKERNDFISKNEGKILAEAYHKAKADGTNPELVKAVEDLLGKETPAQTDGKTEQLPNISTQEALITELEQLEAEYDNATPERQAAITDRFNQIIKKGNIKFSGSGKPNFRGAIAALQQKAAETTSANTKSTVLESLGKTRTEIIGQIKKFFTDTIKDITPEQADKLAEANFTMWGAVANTLSGTKGLQAAIDYMRSKVAQIGVIATADEARTMGKYAELENLVNNSGIKFSTAADQNQFTPQMANIIVNNAIEHLKELNKKGLEILRDEKDINKKNDIRKTIVENNKVIAHLVKAKKDPKFSVDNPLQTKFTKPLINSLITHLRSKGEDFSIEILEAIRKGEEVDTGNFELDEILNGKGGEITFGDVINILKATSNTYEGATTKEILGKLNNIGDPNIGRIAKESIKFSEGETYRGVAIALASGQNIVAALESPAPTTFAHEAIFHSTIEPFLETDPEAKQTFIDEYNDQFGTDKKDWDTDVSERTARVYERYLSNGRKLTAAEVKDTKRRNILQRAFNAFTELMKDIIIQYKDKNIEVSTAAQAYFDKITGIETVQPEATITETATESQTESDQMFSEISEDDVRANTDEAILSGKLTREGINQVMERLGRNKFGDTTSQSYKQAVSIANEQGLLSKDLSAESEVRNSVLLGKGFTSYEIIALQHALSKTLDDINDINKEINDFGGNKESANQILIDRRDELVDKYELFAVAYNKTGTEAGRALVYRKLADTYAFNGVVLKKRLKAEFPDLDKKMMDEMESIVDMIEAKTKELINLQEKVEEEKVKILQEKAQEGVRTIKADNSKPKKDPVVEFKKFFSTPIVKNTVKFSGPSGRDAAPVSQGYTEEQKFEIIKEFARHLVRVEGINSLSKLTLRIQEEYDSIKTDDAPDLTNNDVFKALALSSKSETKAKVREYQKNIANIRSAANRFDKIATIIDGDIIKTKKAKPKQADIIALDKLITDLQKVFWSDDLGLNNSEQNGLMDDFNRIREALNMLNFSENQEQTDAQIEEIRKTVGRINSQLKYERLEANLKKLQENGIPDTKIKSLDKLLDSRTLKIKEQLDELRIELKAKKLEAAAWEKLENKTKILGIKLPNTFFGVRRPVLLYNLNSVKSNFWEYARRYPLGGDLGTLTLQGGFFLYNTLGSAFSPSILTAKGRQKFTLDANTTKLFFKASLESLFKEAAYRKKQGRPNPSLDMYHDMMSTDKAATAKHFGVILNKPFAAQMSKDENELFANKGLGDLKADSKIAQELILMFDKYEKISEGAYTMGLNILRLNMFNSFRIMNENATPDELRQYADEINKQVGTYGKSGSALSKIFTAPRLYYAKIKMLTDLPSATIDLASPEKRLVAKERIKASMHFALGQAMMGGILALLGFEYEEDPRDKDFLKWKKGTVTWDITAGMGKWASLFASIPMYADMAYNNGKIGDWWAGDHINVLKALGGDKNAINLSARKGVDVLDEFKQLNGKPWNLFVNRMSYSLHPTIRNSFAMLQAEDGIGKPLATSWGKRVWNGIMMNMAPISMQDALIMSNTVMKPGEKDLPEKIIDLGLKAVNMTAQFLGTNVQDAENNLKHVLVENHFNKLGWYPVQQFNSKDIIALIPELDIPSQEDVARKSIIKMLRTEVQNEVGTRILEDIAANNGESTLSRDDIADIFASEGERVAEKYKEYYKDQLEDFAAENKAMEEYNKKLRGE